MSTQLIGFSIGGVARRFLVAPPSMSALREPSFIFQLTASSLAVQFGELRVV
jgi:hypothetical protein